MAIVPPQPTLMQLIAHLNPTIKAWIESLNLPDEGRYRIAFDTVFGSQTQTVTVKVFEMQNGSEVVTATHAQSFQHNKFGAWKVWE